MPFYRAPTLAKSLPFRRILVWLTVNSVLNDVLTVFKFEWWERSYGGNISLMFVPWKVAEEWIHQQCQRNPKRHRTENCKLILFSEKCQIPWSPTSQVLTIAILLKRWLDLCPFGRKPIDLGALSCVLDAQGATLHNQW